MKTYYNTKFSLKNLDEAKYDMLYDFLEENNFNWEESDFEEFTIDERTEDEKYQDWLGDQADMMYEESRLVE